MLKIFNFGQNTRPTNVYAFGASGRPFKVCPNAVLDTTDLKPEGMFERVGSLMEVVEKTRVKSFYLQRESTALGDILMMVPVVRYLRTLGYSPYVRTWTKLAKFLELFKVFGEDWHKDTKQLGLLTDGLVERDHWDERVKLQSRIGLLFNAFGLKHIPSKVDWSYNAISFPEVRFATRWVVFQAVSPSPQRSLAPETAQQLVKLMNKDGISVVVIGEDSGLNMDATKNLLRFRQDSLEELFGWIAGAACLITTDSAPLWIDHFTRTPAIVFFGTSRSRERLALHPEPDKVMAVEMWPYGGCKDSCLESPAKCKYSYACMRGATAEALYERIRPRLLECWGTRKREAVKIIPESKPVFLEKHMRLGPMLAPHVGGQTWYDEFNNPVRVLPGEPIPTWILEKYNVDERLIHPDSLRLEGAFEFAAKKKKRFTVGITRDMNGRGDVLLASVIAKALKERYGSDVTVWMAVKEGYEGLLVNNPYINKIYTSETAMHHDGPDIKMNVNDLEFRAEVKALTSEGRIQKNRTSLYLDGMGLSLINKTPFYAVTNEEREWAAKELVRLQYDSEKPIIGLQYLGSNITRTYPHMLDVEVLLGHRGYQTFRLDCKGINGWTYDLRQTAALMERMAVVVSPNSLSYHLAGAMKKRAVALFGSEEGSVWVEDYEKVVALQRDCPLGKPKCWWSLSCLPGASMREKEASCTPACLDSIKPDAVVEEIVRQLTAPKRVLVVVLTWNLLELTKKCIDSIRSWHNYDLFVVDNRSTDGTQAWLEKQGISYVSELCSVAEAWNAGMVKAYEEGYDYVLLCNNDIVLSPNYIDTVVETAERRHALGVTGKVFNRDESTVDKFQYQTQNVEVSVQSMGSGDYSALLLNRTCMEKVGKFDLRFGPRYQADEDHALRMRLIEEPLLKTFKTTFYHLSGAVQISYPGQTVNAGSEWTKNVELFKEKWHVDPYAERQACSDNAEVKKRSPDWASKIKIDIKDQL